MKSYDDIIVADGPLGYWTLQDQGSVVNSLVGNANGTWNGSPPWTMNSIMGIAADCTTQGKYASIPFSALSSYQQCTIEFWYYATSYALSYYTLFGYSPNINAYNGILFSLTGGQASYCGLHSFSNSGALANECRWPQSQLPLNRWNHLMFWLNRGAAAGTWKMFVNGVAATGIIQGNGNSQATNFSSSNLYVASVDGSANFTPCSVIKLAVYSSDKTSLAPAHYSAGLRNGVILG